MMFIDTHAHVDLPRFGDPEEQRFAALRAAEAGIAAIVIPGVEPATWDRLLTVAAELRGVAPSVCFHTAMGIHPQVLPDLDPRGDEAALQELRARVRAAPAGMVAIGECGLDFGPQGEGASRERQVEVLRAHLALARETGLPLLLHCLHAHAALLELLREAPLPPSVLHSYSGSAELVPEYCRLGHAISFAGALTIPRARRPRLAAAAVPADRLLIETDSPDQTPAARRPARNEPAFVVDVARAVAEARGESVEAIAELTTNNARRVLKLAA